ncbi:MAG: YciI family protein [Dehalococcoidia bacterium]|nr:YciI family protein [Dehalococcoidia bacterium]
MKYAFLLYDDEANGDESEEMMGRWFAVDGETVSSGVNRGGEALQPVATSRTVRVRGGKPEVTDGPFAETKEQLGGFYILDVPDLDAAIEWAKKFPNVTSGSVEIRPVLEMQ